MSAQDLFGIKDRLVVVTGGTRGIGASIASAMAEAGAFVGLTSRHEEEAEKAAAALQKKHKVDCRGFACDVGDPKAVKALFRSLGAWTKAPLQAVVNNAGYAIVPDWWNKPLHELSVEEVEKAVRTVASVDLAGSRWMTYYAVPKMVKQGRGSLVYVSSTPALTGYQGFPYTEAKAGILGLMRDVARTYGRHRVRANAVAPGNIRTDWLNHVTAAERKRLEKENPLQRFGEPSEVANVILFLASELSSFVTGETIVVDGGTVIR